MIRQIRNSDLWARSENHLAHTYIYTSEIGAEEQRHPIGLVRRYRDDEFEVKLGDDYHMFETLDEAARALGIDRGES